MMRAPWAILAILTLPFALSEAEIPAEGTNDEKPPQVSLQVEIAEPEPGVPSELPTTPPTAYPTVSPTRPPSGSPTPPGGPTTTPTAGGQPSKEPGPLESTGASIQWVAAAVLAGGVLGGVLVFSGWCRRLP